MYKIIIDNLKKTIEAEDKKTLLTILRENGILIPAVCGGLGLCGSCKIKILSGKVNKPKSEEKKLLGKMIDDGWRLACNVIPSSDLKIYVPIFPSKISKSRKIKTFEINPEFEIIPYAIKMNSNSLEEEIIHYLKKVGYQIEKIEMGLLKQLVHIDKRLNIAISYRDIIDFTDKFSGYGIAIDIGTTTVAVSLRDLLTGRLLDEMSTINSQTTYGMDIISRISFCSEEGGLYKLNKAVIDTINGLIKELVARNKIDFRSIYRVVVAGNSVMTHIFLGIDPYPLGRLPFKPVFREMKNIKAKKLGLNVNEEADVITLPLLGSYIGGDLVGDVLASNFLDYRYSVLIDVGTNGEVLLKKEDKIYAASVPAGPAFEGMGMSSGTIAKSGAIESFSIIGGKILYRTIGNEKPVGICGTGYIDLLAELIDKGIIDRDGRFTGSFDDRIERINGVKSFIVEFSSNTLNGAHIILSQKDVRKLQLALCSFKTALKTLLLLTDVNTEMLEKVVIAGDFGYKINFENARKIGLVPPCERDKVEFIGNGSLTGAEMVLLSKKYRELAKELVRMVSVIDLRKQKNFDRFFIQELRIGWDA